MKTPLKTFEPNLKGRDFVVGDLHGMLPALVNMLANVQFDPENDRLFSVGDLVDRGPDSLGCLRLLREPWFHAVLANHEQMMLEAFAGGYMGNFWIQNGGFWGFSAWDDHEHPERAPQPESVELFSLLSLVDELPYMITINRPDGKKFHVLHAELPPGAFTTDSELSSPEKVRELATTVSSNGGECFMWSRFLFGQFHGVNISQNVEKVKRTIANKYRGGTGPFNDKLSHIISGHTILQRPLTILGQTNIDTGAFQLKDSDAPNWAALTMVDLGSWTFYQATESTFKTVTPVTVNKADIAASAAPVQPNDLSAGIALITKGQ